MILALPDHALMLPGPCLIISAVIFFCVVKPLNHLMSLRKTETPVAPTTRECPFCVSSIPIKATKCAFCTADVPAA